MFNFLKIKEYRFKRLMSVYDDFPELNLRA